MTHDMIEDDHRLDDHGLDASLEGVRRTLDLARRALRARGSSIQSMGGRAAPPAASSILDAEIVSDHRATARLVVYDAEGRLWSDDDRQMLRDLAALLAAEIRLRRERDRERDVLDHLPGLVFERRKTGPAESRYTFLGEAKTALPAVRELLEKGSVGAPLGFVHRDDREAVRSALLRSTIEGSDLDLVFRIKDFDRRSRWLRSQSVARRDASGDLVWSGLCTDVTDLIQSQEQARGDAPAASGSCPSPALDVSARPDEAPRILIADDLDLNRKLIADMLSLEGYAIDCVADGAAAVEAARTKTYDLILMDMIMPGLDGLEATRAIRALPAPACAVPIVALTAHSLREDLAHCLDAGMDATLTKPMSFEALANAVSTWTKRRQAA